MPHESGRSEECVGDVLQLWKPLLSQRPSENLIKVCIVVGGVRRGHCHSIYSGKSYDQLCRCETSEYDMFCLGSIVHRNRTYQLRLEKIVLFYHSRIRLHTANHVLMFCIESNGEMIITLWTQMPWKLIHFISKKANCRINICLSLMNKNNMRCV